MSREQEFLVYFESQSRYAVERLGALVSIDSPTTDKDGVDRVGALLAEEFRAAGAAVTVMPQHGAGYVVRAAFGPRDGSGDERPALLLGHLDTVWPLGEAARRPFRVDGACATGPGVYDMKIGLVLCLILARAFKEHVLRARRPVVCLFSADEETGSPVSRPQIETEARDRKSTRLNSSHRTIS